MQRSVAICPCYATVCLFGALFKMSAKMTRFSNQEFLVKNLLQQLVLWSMVISVQCMSSKDNKINKKTFHLLKRTLRRKPPFCFVSLLCNSLFQTASQLRTQLQSAMKCFLVTYHCIAKRYKVLCNARLMQLVPDQVLVSFRLSCFPAVFTLTHERRESIVYKQLLQENPAEVEITTKSSVFCVCVWFFFVFFFYIPDCIS